MIRTHPDPILYRPSAPATDEDFQSGYVALVAGELEQQMTRLEETTGLRAMGLSAPQIGYSIRIFRLAQWPTAFVNPEIEYKTMKGQHVRPWIEPEGCFSLPGVSLDVTRAREIKMRYLTLAGEERATKMRDRDARAAQHEHDHLQGVTIIQRASNGSEGLVVAGLEAAL